MNVVVAENQEMGGPCVKEAEAPRVGPGLGRWSAHRKHAEMGSRIHSTSTFILSTVIPERGWLGQLGNSPVT